ncbi:hypothetical protein BDW71DRAFT_191621 [Aspergillus fruticulosus]
MVGNSWPGTFQWFIAAGRPPHLSCMLPLEGEVMSTVTPCAGREYRIRRFGDF